MGKSVAKQLAAKGANLIIVSRNVTKLEAALSEIKVITPSKNEAGSDGSTGFSNQSLNPAIPLHQRRRFRRRRSYLHNKASNDLE